MDWGPGLGQEVDCIGLGGAALDWNQTQSHRHRRRVRHHEHIWFIMCVLDAGLYAPGQWSGGLSCVLCPSYNELF